jgi:hypothetical protein
MVPHSSDEPNVREPRHAEAGPMDPWVRAVLALPALALADLPEPITLHLHVPGAPGSVVFTTQRIPCSDPCNTAAGTARTAALNATSSAHSHVRPHADAVRAVLTFDRDELRALVLGVEADRIWHREFLGFCFEKWRAPAFRLTAELALGGANRDCQASWSCERFLQRLQARLCSVEFAEGAAVDSTVSDASDADSRERSGDIHHTRKRPLPLLWAAA